MSVKLNERQVGDVTIVEATGYVTLGEGSGDLRNKLRELMQRGRKKILLDLGEISYMDSSGLGEMVSAFTVVANGGGQLKICHISRRVGDLMHCAKLYTVFDVHEDESAAVRSFG